MSRLSVDVDDGSAVLLPESIFPASSDRRDQDLDGEAPAIGDLSETLKQARARA